MGTGTRTGPGLRLPYIIMKTMPQLAGKARQLGCPKIVLDHMRVYIYNNIYIYIMYVRFGFPHYCLYTMLLTMHLPRGLRGLRTSNVSWQTTVN